MKLQEALIKAIKVLNENNIEEASLVSKMLLANNLNMKKEELVINSDMEIPKDKEEEFFNGIFKISKGYPIQYLMGYKEFMKMKFFVNENVLVPRADTEVLVEEVINLAKNKRDVLELCTGSGAIAISLSKYVEDLKITATDISKCALEVAKKNAKELLDRQNVSFIISDMFQNVDGKYDIIVSNPPYIKSSTIKEYSLAYEPSLALDRTEKMDLNFTE